MKVILVLLFCGLSGVLGEFNCNQDYPKECTDSIETRWNVNDFGPETAEDLKDFCKPVLKSVRCQLDFAIQCPRTLTGATRKASEAFLKTYERICDENDPLHKKYLENIHCLNKEVKSSERDCEDYIKEQEYCKRTSEVLGCTEDELVRKCGKDGEELITELFKYKYEMRNVFCL